MVVARSNPEALEVRTFFELLFAGVPDNLYTVVSGFTSQFEGRASPSLTQAFRVSDLDGITACVERYREARFMRLYFRTSYLAASPKEGRGKEADTVGTNLLWADLDIRDKLDENAVLAELEQWTCPPTFVVHSGGGLQVYWKLAAFCRDLEAVKGRNRWIAEQLAHLAADNVPDLARVFRVPTTYNHKYFPKICVAHVLSSHSERLYQLSDFEQAAPKQRTSSQSNDTLLPEREELPPDFLESIKKRSAYLYDRILSEKTAERHAQMNKAGTHVDRSLNDHYIACTLLEYGYTPAQVCSVLTHHLWYSGERYRTAGGAEYVSRTLASAVAQVDAQGKPAQYFDKRFFVAERMWQAIRNRDHHFLLVNDNLYHYEHGVYKNGGKRFVEQEVLLRLSDRWTSHYGTETVKLAELQAPIYDFTQEPERKDASALWINTLSGMMNVATGDVRPHSPKDRSINQIPIWYEPAQRCPLIEEKVAQVLPEDAILAWWEFIGYCLLPDVRFRKAMLLIGPHHSGKSLLVSLVQRFLGAANISNFTLQNICDTRFTASGLPGMLANTYADLSTAEIKNPGDFKAFVAGDALSIQRKFHDEVPVFVPTAKHLYSVNNFPSLAAADSAWVDRFLVIRLANQFNITPDRSDPMRADVRLIDRLSARQNLSGMFNLALDGLRRLLARESFSESPGMKAARDEYHMHLDSIYAFYNVQTVADDAKETGYIPERRAYEAFSNWTMNTNRGRGTSDRTFYAHTKELLRDLGMSLGKKTIDGHEVRVYRGRRLVERVEKPRSTVTRLVARYT